MFCSQFSQRSDPRLCPDPNYYVSVFNKFSYKKGQKGK